MWLWHGSLGSEFSKLKFELESQDPSALRNKEVDRWTGPASSLKTKVGGDSWWRLRNNCQSSRPQWYPLPVTAPVGGGVGNRWRVLDGRTRVRSWPMVSLDRGWRPSSFLLRLCALSLALFFSFWLCWVFAAARGLSLVAVSRGGGFSLWWPLLLWRTGSRHAGFGSWSMPAQ